MKLAVSTFTLFALCAAIPADPPLYSEGMQSRVTQDGLLDTLRHLDRIAAENGGNRATGTPGFAASLDYLTSRLATSRKYRHWTQEFPVPLFNGSEKAHFSVNGQSIPFSRLTFSPETLNEDVTAAIIKGPAGPAACDINSYKNLNVKGKIVLLDNTECPTGGPLETKVDTALNSGAAAVIISRDESDGPHEAPVPECHRPGGFISKSDGLTLLSRLHAGEKLTGHYTRTQTVSFTHTQNIFAESRAGDPNNIIMFGTHLDSVTAGPGINDDASGVSLLLALFDAAQHYTPRNKLRFAFWAAEENAMIGSRYFTSHISPSEADKILVYVNFDMVGRGQAFGVFNASSLMQGIPAAPGSRYIERLFTDHLTEKKIPITPFPFTRTSDYADFMSLLDKPVGGIHTGIIPERDPCYHQACDTISNINITALEINAKAAAHALAVLSNDAVEHVPKTPYVPQTGVRDFGPDGDADSLPWNCAPKTHQSSIRSQ
ncbi:hypothetical protein Dda_8363 [Drechslerella dactyloides]|uniref:Peptide hydrolase n=1 Tax=Drechslerella dactyloides TaxID=74499 RepID=A0AAD6IT49_DREDA|nr:hypothetical protein Dda_8363 [Drechslerella dactyloides]